MVRPRAGSITSPDDFRKKKQKKEEKEESFRKLLKDREESELNHVFEKVIKKN